MSKKTGTEDQDRSKVGDGPRAAGDGLDGDGAAAVDGLEATLTYGQALEELEELLDELEGADVDVDLLAERVARGVQLVRFCRARLEVVNADVDEVVAELISVDAGGVSEAEEP